MNVVYSGQCCCGDFNCPEWTAILPERCDVEITFSELTRWRVNGAIVCQATSSVEIDATYRRFNPAGQNVMYFVSGSVTVAGTGTSRYLSCPNTALARSWGFSVTQSIPGGYSGQPFFFGPQIVCYRCLDSQGNTQAQSEPLSYLTPIGSDAFTFQVQRFNQLGQFIGTETASGRAVIGIRDSKAQGLSSASFRRFHSEVANSAAAPNVITDLQVPQSFLFQDGFLVSCGDQLPIIDACDKFGVPLSYNEINYRGCTVCSPDGTNIVPVTFEWQRGYSATCQT
jgi:hypothetical protein